jgi:hypothetical protein
VTTLAAVATALAAVVGLVLYLYQRSDTPETRYAAAIAAYEKAVNDEAELKEELKAELDHVHPDPGAVVRLSDAVRAAGRRVRQCAAECDRLRP